MLFVQIHRGSQGTTQDEAHEMQKDKRARLPSLCYHSSGHGSRALNFQEQRLRSTLLLYHIKNQLNVITVTVS